MWQSENESTATPDVMQARPIRIPAIEWVMPMSNSSVNSHISYQGFGVQVRPEHDSSKIPRTGTVRHVYSSRTITSLPHPIRSYNTFHQFLVHPLPLPSEVTTYHSNF